MIGSVLAVTVPGFAIGAVGMALYTRDAARDVSRSRWLKFGVFAGIVHAVLLAAYFGRPAIVAVLVLIVVACAAEVAAAWRRVPEPRPRRAIVVYACVAGLAVATALRASPAALAWAFLVVASADGFAQVTGQLLGRHRLAPRTSPGKTVEGAIGGFVAAVVVGAAAHRLLDRGVLVAAGIALVFACLGLAGDLAASWLKRRAGLKDYSRALPGQGGVLDRFDSLLGALALGGALLV